jgi:hypothetical protein
VGKRPDGLVALTPPRLGTGGSVTGGSVLVAGGDTVGEGAAETITAAAEVWKADAPVPLAAAASLICSPSAAAFRTLTVTFSSSDCPSGRLPTLHTEPLGFGQMAKRGESTCWGFPIFVLTDTPWLPALVLQTQIAYVTVRPGWTWDEFEKA